LAWPRAGFGPGARELKKFLFLLSELVWLVLNFKNSYLYAHSSKNYEISSVGLISKTETFSSSQFLLKHE
jgi:hypothetical protein